jgi:surface polysaccharide O-acyltransferase-like enzyme
MTPGQLTGAVLLSFALTIFSSSVDGLNSAANVTYIDDFPRYLGYLLAGHLLGRVVPLPSFVTTVAALVAAFLILAGAAYIAAQVASPPRAMRLFGFGNPAVIVLSLAAFAMLRRVSVAAAWRVWLVRAGAMSFGIYLVHPAILDGVQNWMSPNSLPAFVGVVMLGLLSSALVILIMQRLPVVRRCV